MNARPPPPGVKNAHFARDVLHTVFWNFKLFFVFFVKEANKREKNVAGV